MTYRRRFLRNTILILTLSLAIWAVFVALFTNSALSAPTPLLLNPITWSLHPGPQPSCLTIHTLSTPPTRLFAAIRPSSNPYSAFASTLDIYDPTVSNTSLTTWISTIHAICPGAQS